MAKKLFDSLIIYRQPVRSTDSFGQVVETFSDYQKAFVQLESFSGNEAVQGERMQATNQTTFFGHYVSGVDTTFQISYESETWNILDIEPVERKRWMRVKAEKIND